VNNKSRHRRRLWLATGLVVSTCTLLSGCTGAFDPQAEQSRNIAGIWWVMLWISCAVFAIVIGLTGYALFRKHEPSVFEKKPRSAFTFIVVGGAIVPLLILGAVFGYSLDVIGQSGSDTPNQLLVVVTGHQFWYQIDYPAQHVSSRNEMHIPEHQQVKIELKSDDVIHSFWVPQLNGKTDIIPGITNELYFTDPNPGTYIGHCAEFCGIGHTTMQIKVVVQSEDAFQSWLKSQAS